MVQEEYTRQLTDTVQCILFTTDSSSDLVLPVLLRPRGSAPVTAAIAGGIAVGGGEDGGGRGLS